MDETKRKLLELCLDKRDNKLIDACLDIVLQLYSAYGMEFIDRLYGLSAARGRELVEIFNLHDKNIHSLAGFILLADHMMEDADWVMQYASPTTMVYTTDELEALRRQAR